MVEEAKQPAKCLNCDAPLLGVAKYCSACGQRNRATAVTLWCLVSEFFTQQFALESRLFRSLKTLFWRPGQLTLDYWQGKRARYLSPIQIYLIASVLFFLLMDISSTFSTNSALQVQAPDWEAAIDSFEEDSIRVNFGVKSALLTKEQFVEFLKAEPSELTAFFAKHKFELDPVAMYFARLSHQVMQPGGLKQFVESYLSLISQTVIVMMPIFGLILYVLNFWRAKKAVLCILFSAHVHAYAYFVLALAMLLAMLWSEVIVQVVPIAATVNFVVAQKRVFGGNWILLLIKSLAAVMLYAISILFFVILLIPFVGFTM